MKKLAIFLFFLALIAGLYFLTPLRQYLSPSGITDLRAWILAQGIWAPVVFALIYILATLFALPGSLLTISGGVLFGTAWGTLINLTAATIGAGLAFLFSRYLGREFIARRLSGKIQNLDDKVGKHGFYTVLYLRLVPLFPFNVLNFSLGLSKVSFRDYVLGTFIGMAPGAFVFTSLGGAALHFDLKDPQVWLDYHVWGPFALVILLALLPAVVKRLRNAFA